MVEKNGANWLNVGQFHRFYALFLTILLISNSVDYP